MEKRQIFEYTREQEDQIIIALASHNVPLATAYINNVLDENLLERDLSPEMTRCFLCCLTETLVRAAKKIGKSVCSQIDEIKKRMFTVKKEMEYTPLSPGWKMDKEMEELRGAFTETAREIGEQKIVDRSSRDQRLCQEIVEYISNNYWDPELNVAKVGDYLQLSPNYISTIFRRETGNRLVEVIARTRVLEAEKLLMTGAGVMTTGERTGFNDNTTFIRTFKKYTGITPGQMRAEYVS
ncbi:MAG: helix-turn-helix transcriptional regulator [Fusicatenibacter sp.]